MGRKKSKKITITHGMRRSIIIAIALLIIIFLINVAPNYVKEASQDGIRVIINNNNVTSHLKKKIVVQADKPYMSTADIQNFFDEFLTEEENTIITTSNTKTVQISKVSNAMNINGANVKLENSIVEEDNSVFLPVSEMANVYNYEYSFSENTLMIDSLNKKLVRATSAKDQSIKFKATEFSKSIEKIKRGDSVVIVQDSQKNEDTEVDGYYKVRSKNGNIGYIKKSNLIGRTVVRDNLEQEKIKGKVSLAWEYYNQYTAAPTKSAKIDGINAVSPSFYELKSDGSLVKNVSEEYIKWAHESGYKVWPTVSNSSLNNLDSVSEIMSNFETRQNLIENIISSLIDAGVDGVTIDFENMYKEDKDKYSRFIIELVPRIKEMGMTTCVEVTEPDGSDTWSLCYDRNTIGKVADYVVFIGYGQHTGSSTSAGTVAGANWEEINIKKFLGQEGVPKEKLILAMPFYTRLWKEENGKLSSQVVNMNKITIPSGIEKKWDNELKQNYIEYQSGNATYKMWIEDEESISAKLDLVNQYDIVGAGFWEIDRETAGVWNIVSNKLGVK